MTATSSGSAHCGINHYATGIGCFRHVSQSKSECIFRLLNFLVSHAASCPSVSLSVNYLCKSLWLASTQLHALWHTVIDTCSCNVLFSGAWQLCGVDAWAGAVHWLSAETKWYGCCHENNHYQSNAGFTRLWETAKYCELVVLLLLLLLL